MKDISGENSSHESEEIIKSRSTGIKKGKCYDVWYSMWPYIAVNYVPWETE